MQGVAPAEVRREPANRAPSPGSSETCPAGLACNLRLAGRREVQWVRDCGFCDANASRPRAISGNRAAAAPLRLLSIPADSIVLLGRAIPPGMPRPRHRYRQVQGSLAQGDRAPILASLSGGRSNSPQGKHPQLHLLVKVWVPTKAGIKRGCGGGNSQVLKCRCIPGSHCPGKLDRGLTPRACEQLSWRFR